MKRQILLLILLVPLMALAIVLWTSGTPPRVILVSLFDWRKPQTFALDQTKAITLVKKSDLPPEFVDQDHERIRLEVEKDGKNYETLPCRALRLVEMPTISTSGSRGTSTYAVLDMSQEAPADSIYVYDLSLLSAETGTPIRFLKPKNSTEPGPWQRTR